MEHYTNKIIYIIIAVVILIVRARRTKKLNEQKRLEKLAKAKVQQNTESPQSENNIASVINDMFNQPKPEPESKKQADPKEKFTEEIIDYDSMANDPTIDLIPDTPIKIKEKTEKSFFEEYFNEEFDIKKAVIYSEIINKKY